MKYLFLISILMVTPVRGDELSLTTEKDAQTCIKGLVIKNKPSKAYLEKMKRLKDLEQEVASLKQEIAELKESASNKKPEENAKAQNKDVQKNSLSILGVAATTKLQSSFTDISYKASNDYEPDLGVMYQRDFNAFRATLGATIKGTVLIGAGLRF